MKWLALLAMVVRLWMPLAHGGRCERIASPRAHAPAAVACSCGMVHGETFARDAATPPNGELAPLADAPDHVCLACQLEHEVPVDAPAALAIVQPPAPHLEPPPHTKAAPRAPPTHTRPPARAPPARTA